MTDPTTIGTDRVPVLPQNGLGIEDRVLLALRRIARAIDLHSQFLRQRFGLTAPQLAALQVVDRSAPVTVGTMARQLHLSHATVTGVVARLHSRGLVTRGRPGSDRRNVVVELTEPGRQVLGASPPLLQSRFRRKLARLPEWEQTNLLATLQRIGSMMEEPETDSQERESWTA